jgi:hypothetical protein
MENKPKKSKAFIITFVLILLLLLAGYWLFTNKDKVFKTGGLNLGRIFEPLVESPDRKPLRVIWDSVFNPGKVTPTEDPDAFVYDPNNNVYNLPVINISASPSSIQEGESSIISWTSNNAVSCKTPDGIQTGTSGSFSTGTLNKSKSFAVSCSGKNGTVSSNITIRVGNRDIDPFLFPIVSGNAQPSPIQPGESSTVSWDSNNTTSCDAGAGNPTTTRGSFETGPLYATTAYTIICTGDDGTSGRNVFVIVRDMLDYELDKCTNGTDNYPLCTTKNGQCINGATNPPLCTTTADNKCLNGATNPEACDIFENAFCAANKITEELSTTNKSNKEQVTFLQTILSKLPSSSGQTYLKDTDIDGDYGQKTRTAVIQFQKDNSLPETGAVDIDTMNTVNNKCNEFFNNSGLAQCNDGIDNDGKEGIDSEDQSCHSDFNANNPNSYDKFIRDEGRVKTNAECGDGINNDNEEGPDYQDKDCHTDGNVNNWDSYYKDIVSEKTNSLPIPDNVCSNNATNPPLCTTGEDGKCLNGANNPPICNTFDKCPNPEAVNYPQCDRDADGNCLNGATNATCTLDPTEENKCAIFDQYPLDFTLEEEKALAELLRKFYLIAPSLKTEENLNLVSNEIEKYKLLINQTVKLTKQCYLDTGYQNNWNWGYYDTYNFCTRNPGVCSSKGVVKKSVCDANPTYCEGKDINNDTYEPPATHETNDYSNGFITRYGNPWFNSTSIGGSYIDKKNAREIYPLGKKLNMDENYTMKLKQGMPENVYGPYILSKLFILDNYNDIILSKYGDKDIYTPLIVKKPLVQSQGSRKTHFIWNWYDSFDLNGVMLDRIHEFEKLLYIW